MKKNTYLHDIIDTFGDKTTSKDALKIAKNIKSSQKKAFPSIEFKQHLGDRLSNMYAFQIEDDVQPRFSLVQLFGALASFIFISGGLISFYSVSDITKIKNQATISSMSNPDSESIPLMDVLIPKAMKLQEEENMNDAASNFIPQDIMESDIFESSLRQVETFSDENIQNNSNIDVVELCELYQGGYNIDTQTCILPNGVVCQNYDEEGMNECFQRDDSILR